MSFPSDLPAKISKYAEELNIRPEALAIMAMDRPQSDRAGALKIENKAVKKIWKFLK